VYDFGTSYRHILDDLTGKDSELYTRNGLLKMVSRNVDIKLAPEKWQLEVSPPARCALRTER
jgi:RNA polymerase II subunit A C-terminal domain phosphatase SSU72